MLIHKPSTARDRYEFSRQFASIVLTLLSIIQGLAFASLCQKIIQLFAVVDFGIELLLHFGFIALCAALIARVFQTYLTAALAYHSWKADVWDYLSIYAIGLLEFSLISALPMTGDQDQVLRYFRALTLFSGIAYLVVYRAYIRAPRLPFWSEEQRFWERKVQVGNIRLGAAIMLLSLAQLISIFCEVPFFFVTGSFLAWLAAVLILIRIQWAIRDLFSRDLSIAETDAVCAPAALSFDGTTGLESTICLPEKRGQRTERVLIWLGIVLVAYGLSEALNRRDED